MKLYSFNIIYNISILPSTNGITKIHIWTQNITGIFFIVWYESLFISTRILYIHLSYIRYKTLENRIDLMKLYSYAYIRLCFILHDMKQNKIHIGMK